MNRKEENMSANELRIGLIGLDTSHCIAFAKRLNDPADPEHIKGGRVVAAFPGGSPDFKLSISRVPGFVKQLSENFNVQMMVSPEAVAEAVDLVFIISADARVHLDHFARTVRFRRPTFIDKAFTLSSSDAQEIFRLAREAGVPVMSCSSLRYAENLLHALSDDAGGAVGGCDVFGPMEIQPTQPGLFWYGIHSVETMNRIMGRGCKQVHAVTNADGDVVTGVWTDGRMATIRGLRKRHSRFAATIHREKDYQFVDISGGKRSYYAGMLEAIMQSLPSGRSDVAPEDTLEIIRFIEAANESRETGKTVTL
jgi:predicted dehydrogenase